jgi:hypothetical protein
MNEDIDLGREYSILHTTLANLFKELHLNIRQSLNELEYILKELSSKRSETHSISSSNYSSLYDSQISLPGTINDSSQGYLIDHSNNSQQPLVVSNNSYMRNSMQSLPSSNNDATNSNIYPLKTDEEINQMEKQQTVLSAQQ